MLCTMPEQSDFHLRAKIAANTRWAHVANRSAATAPARAAFNSRFEREVDPDGLLPPEERARRADSARSAYYARLAYQSAKKRRKGKRTDSASE
jgi:hypothetical protein